MIYGSMQHFRFDRIISARSEVASFQRDPAFNLPDHSARAFGSYHAEKEYCEVFWRFNLVAAPVAREFLSHCQQVAEGNADGSLAIQFHAPGRMEMAWHLYQWSETL